MEGLAIVAGLLVLVGVLVWRNGVMRARSAEDRQRADALDANQEATRDAERILDAGDRSIADRLALAEHRRELRRQTRTP